MVFRSARYVLLCSLALLSSSVLSAETMESTVPSDNPAPEANGAAGAGLEEIVVTARKKAESLMSAPVDVQAITAAQLQNLHITDMKALSAVTPDLDITVAFATVGATVNMRGLTNGFAANFIDQSVALNVDGATLSHGAFYRGALFDVNQIEVLKGPQDLFFGKSSDAGIIAITTADPGKSWETELTAGYGIHAAEMNVNGFISGPVTDQLGVRVAFFYDSMKGYFYNNNPSNPNHRLPDGTTGGGRLTLKYDNEDVGLHARFKASASQNNDNAPDGDLNQHLCPTGAPQGGFIYDNCKIDNVLAGTPRPLPYLPQLDYNPFNAAAFAQGCPNLLCRNGDGYQFTNTTDSLLNVDYDITNALRLTSVTSWDFVKAQENSRNYQPFIDTLGLGAQYFEHEYSEELRLASNWRDSWINFMAGGLYNSGTAQNNLLLVTPTTPVPGLGNLGLYTFDKMGLVNIVSSAFGQITLTPIEHWELSAGLRYTYIHKYFNSLVTENNYPAFFLPGPSGENIGNVPRSSSSVVETNRSPEATLTYRPTDTLTVYASYKQGYKGPGFNANTVTTSFTADNVGLFAGEVVRGFEGGIKTQLLERQLAVILNGYRYTYDNLQVAFPDVSTSTVNINNGARARVQGIELSADFRPSWLRGWTFNASLDYNNGKYLSFPAAPCYTGQSVAAGCLVDPVLGPSQDLGGRHLSDAPLYAGNFGMEYTTAVSENYMITAGLSGKYSSDYYSSTDAHPLSTQGGYVTLDANVHFARKDGSWDLALLGRNITNRIYTTGSESGPLATPGVTGDLYAFVNRPYELTLQLTVRPTF